MVADNEVDGSIDDGDDADGDDDGGDDDDCDVDDDDDAYDGIYEMVLHH